MNGRKPMLVILVGMRSSPFLKALTRSVYEINYVANNLCDFHIEHQDPSKSLSFHLELFNFFETLAAEEGDSINMLNFLESSFELYNPLGVSTFRNLLAKFSAHVEREK
ncbi:MAG: hypothetical protein ACTSRA_18120, partial [Promethearchaeota archaeon]